MIKIKFEQYEKYIIILFCHITQPYRRQKWKKKKTESNTSAKRRQDSTLSISGVVTAHSTVCLPQQIGQWHFYDTTHYSHPVRTGFRENSCCFSIFGLQYEWGKAANVYINHYTHPRHIISAVFLPCNYWNLDRLLVYIQNEWQVGQCTKPLTEINRQYL